jgi:hypothetical protein
MPTKAEREQQAEIRRLNAERRRLQGRESVPSLSGVPAPEPTKRLTVSEVTRALLNRTPQDRSHVGLSRGTTGGQVGIEVVVYVGEGGAATLEEATARCQSTFAQLAKQHPAPKREAGK